MQAQHVVVLVMSWAALSVPVSLLLGLVIRRAEDPRAGVRTSRAETDIAVAA